MPGKRNKEERKTTRVEDDGVPGKRNRLVEETEIKERKTTRVEDDGVPGKRNKVRPKRGRLRE